jgi:hypothetical protein
VQTLAWNAYGKVSQVVKGDVTMTFGYDAQQNRLKKEVITGEKKKINYSFRDAQGNVLAVYERRKENEKELLWKHFKGCFESTIKQPLIMRTIFYGFLIGSWMSCSSLHQIRYQLPMPTRYSIQQEIHKLDSLTGLNLKKNVYVTLYHQDGAILLLFNQRPLHPELQRLVRQTHHYLVLNETIPMIMQTDLWSLQNPTLNAILPYGFWVRINDAGCFLGSGLSY